MSDRDQTDATLLRCALRQCEREREAARANVDRLAKELCNARRERDEMIDAANNARRDRDAWCRIAGGITPARPREALAAAHRETIRGASEYLRDMGDFRLACELLDILTTAGEAKP